MNSEKIDYDKKKIGDKNFIAHAPKGASWVSVSNVFSSWTNNNFRYPESKSEGAYGFRSAQLGALFAIKSHWTVSSLPATIVMPTGTGKTETMIATVLSERCKKTCIVVPSNLLRKQTLNRFCTLQKLREIRAVTNSLKNPIVGCLLSTPKNINDLKYLVNSSNVIITTMSLLNRFNDELLTCLSNLCDTLIIDEAHHVAANSWKRVKNYFNNAKCLQFTATPFRNDGEKVDGDIIYNFPLALAQKHGYFKTINFFPIYEFDNDKKDESIAAKAVELLKTDIKMGYPHLLLVRASTQARAKQLFSDVYSKLYPIYNPVLIVSSNRSTKNNEELQKVINGQSKIIVCVDMFSEGIDIPQLKICAIHDKYKSLPITLQFIGRFARTQTNLGEASIVANVVDDDIKDSLEELYSQDSDWNKIIRNVSDEKIGREVELQKLARGFTGTEVIPFNQIRPKVSMFMYTTAETRWHWKQWRKVFNEECSNYYVNEQEKILIITQLCNMNVDWTVCRDITDNVWNLHILYWNERKNVFYINTTDKSIADRFAEAVFLSSRRINGENVFRCLHGINRLMLATVGLKTSISNHHICYRMFAGTDVEEGITQAIKSTATKSNLFGVGFENGNSMSIGCSYKGTIWARWVETIDYWKEWCDRQAEKILDESIDTADVLSGALVPKEITERPAVVPYRIDFPIEVEDELKDSIMLRTNLHESQPFLIDIGMTKFDENSPLTFSVGNDDFKEEFKLVINDSGYTIAHNSGSIINIKLSRGREMSLKDFFNENPPTIWFVDGSSLEGNLFVKVKSDTSATFPVRNIEAWNWSDVNIQKESQGLNRETDSIQYKLISYLKKLNKYCLIYDDDGSGEVADVIAIQEDDLNRKLLFELYHCKFSSDGKAGSRVGDLYVVCCQAEKCIKWTSNAKFLLDRLIKRENYRMSKNKHSRYEVGDNRLLFTLKNKLKVYSSEYKVYIVQPGVDSNKITTPMHQVLCSASAYLMDTHGITLKLICS